MSRKKAEDRLLPCPFCGGRTRLLPYRHPTGATGMTVSCTVCGVTKKETTRFKDQIVAAWNRRQGEEILRSRLLSAKEIIKTQEENIRFKADRLEHYRRRLALAHKYLERRSGV